MRTYDCWPFAFWIWRNARDDETVSYTSWRIQMRMFQFTGIIV